jgi:hypothetical protein
VTERVGTMPAGVAGLILAGVLLTSACGGSGGGGTSPPPQSNPVPSIISLSPSSVAAGASAQTLTINGSNFISGSTVAYNNAAHSASFVNSTQLTVSLSASDLAAAGSFAVVGTNPSPGGGSSNPFAFTVSSVQALPTGTVTVLGPTTCGSGAGITASCTSVVVACAGIPDLGATLAVSRPTGNSRGTIVLLSGGSGTGNLNNGFVDAYVGDGFQVVQVAWASDWASANGAGFTSTSCRPSTVFKYVFQAVQGSSRASGFCGQGISGGGAQLAHSLTLYGLQDFFDYLVIAAGPAVTRLDYGCDPPLYTGPPRDLCPLLTNAPFTYTGGVPNTVNNWERTTTCGTSNPPAADINRWTTDSIVAPGANFSYPHTSISWFFCVTPSTINESTGQGSFLIDAVRPMNAPPDVNCYSGICQGEAVWSDPNAFAATESEMVAQCVPNHGGFH